MISIARTHSSNVKNWQTPPWPALARGRDDRSPRAVRRVNGHLHLPALRAPLDAHAAAETIGAVRHDVPVIAA